MNVEKLNNIISFVADDIKKINLIAVLNDFTAHLTNLSSQPNNSSFQSNYSTSLSNLNIALVKSKLNTISPGWIQVLQDLQLYEFTGNRLKVRIENIIQKNQITLSVAVQEIQKITVTVNAFYESISKVISGFESLGIESEEIENDEAELGILIPREYVNNNLMSFSKELKELEYIINTFNEIKIGSRNEIQIRTIASSDLSIYLQMLPGVAAFMAVAIERIIALYKSLLEIKKLHLELEKQNVPKTNLKGIEDHANSIMKDGIKDLTELLISENYSGNDSGRKNELKKGLNLILNKIANRIDRGYNFEIRVSETETEISESDKASKKIIKEKAIKLQFINSTGKPILSLPEADPKDLKKDDK